MAILPDFNNNNEMKSKSLDVLQKMCLQFLKDNNYSESTIEKYRGFWKNGINTYCQSNGITEYHPTVGQDFLRLIYSDQIGKNKYQEYLKGVRALDDILVYGKIKSHKAAVVTYDFDCVIGQKMSLLIAELEELNCRPYTIKEYKRVLWIFLDYLKTNNIWSLKDISEEIVLSYLDSIQQNRNNYTLKIRRLFKFWKKQGILDNGIAEALNTIRLSRREPIPSYFSPEEVIEIEKSVDRNTCKGKRDYAMILLASRLGLRVSDIVNLKLSNIDWDNSKISLIMEKTGRNIELPLLADVGNALADYLRNGRPKTTLRNVFLKEVAPYGEMTSGCAYSAFNHAIAKSKIYIDNRHHGPHAFRHSLASAMLGQGTTLPVITDVLGHSSSETTMSYIKIDIQKLMACALEVPVVDDKFYNQKGGVFYE